MYYKNLIINIFFKILGGFKVKTNNYKHLSLIIVLAIFALITQDAMGQHLVNKSGAKITNIGTIRLVQEDGVFQNEGTATTGTQYDAEPVAFSPSSGTIEFTHTANLFGGGAPLGEDDLSRINGWVRYAGAIGDPQLVQGRYYSNLAMSSTDIKDFTNVTVYVDHIYTVIGTADRNYNESTFYYDGEAGEDQTIFPEENTSGNNIYYKLYFDQAGVKTLEQGKIANASNEINLTSNAPNVTILGHMNAIADAEINTLATSILNIGGDADGTGYEDGLDGDGIFTTNNGAGTYAGLMYIYNEGTFETKGTGKQSIIGGDVVVGQDVTAALTLNGTSGSFTLEAGDAEIGAGGTLTLANVGGTINVGPARTLTVSGDGDFENAVAWGTTGNERANFNFDDASFIHYTGSDVIEAPTEDYPYGTLLVSGATKNIETSTIAFISEDFGLADSDLLADSDGNLTDGISREAIAMLDETASATFGPDLELVGKMRRYFNATTNELTFNNAITTVTVTDGDAPVFLDLSIWKGQEPAASDYDEAFDVKRKTVWDYELDAGKNFTSTLKLAYLDNEYLAGQDADPVIAARNKNSIRFRESGPEAAGLDPHKIATGEVVTRNIAYDQASSFAYAVQPGISSDNSHTLASAYVIDANEIYLRGGPTWFITIAPGRWSNPDTWDEGVQPGPLDYTKVRHTVWAGFNRTDIDGVQPDERTHLVDNFSLPAGTATQSLAAYIWIAGDNEYNGMLMFGGGKGGTNEADTDFGITVTGVNSLTNVLNPGAPPTLNLNDYTGLGDAGSIAIDKTAANLLGVTAVTAITDLSTYTDLQDNGGNETTLYNGGLLLFDGATFRVANQGINYGTITNGGTIIVGTNP